MANVRLNYNKIFRDFCPNIVRNTETMRCQTSRRQKRVHSKLSLIRFIGIHAHIGRALLYDITALEGEGCVA